MHRITVGFVAVVVATIVLPGTLLAQKTDPSQPMSQPAVKSPVAEPVMLTIRQAHDVLHGLVELSAGSEVPVKVDGKDRIVRQPYKGWSLAITIAILKNIDALKESTDIFKKAVQQRRAQLAAEDGSLSSSDQRLLEKEMTDKAEELVSFNLFKIKTSDLKPEVNGVIGMLVALSPILLLE